MKTKSKVDGVLEAMEMALTNALNEVYNIKTNPMNSDADKLLDAISIPHNLMANLRIDLLVKYALEVGVE